MVWFQAVSILNFDQTWTWLLPRPGSMVDWFWSWHCTMTILLFFQAFFVNILLLGLLGFVWTFYYWDYWDYCDHCYYCAGKCFAWEIGLNGIEIGLNGIRAAQGPLLAVQRFNSWSHQVQWFAASLLQPVKGPVSCKAVLWQSPPGPHHDSAAGSRPWGLRGVARFSLVCTGFTPFLSHIANRHRVQNVWMCTGVNDGNIRRPWTWYLLSLLSLLTLLWNALTSCHYCN
jgi:hypothetical protein